MAEPTGRGAGWRDARPVLVLQHHVEAPVDWRSAQRVRHERVEVRPGSKDANTRSRARRGSSFTFCQEGGLGKRERMSQVEGGRFARVGSHLPTEPSSRPRPSREKFGLNASTMVSCARHSEGKEGEKEGRNCSEAASFSFSLAAQVFFRRFTGRSGSKEKNQEACAWESRAFRKATAERQRDDETLKTRPGSCVETAYDSSRACHCAEILARRRARPVPRQIREQKNTPFHAP